MRKIIDFIKRDLRHIKGNVIALVVIMGIIVVPTFYAWFNIGGFWDPYSNTKNLKVAVANSDLGYTSDLMPIEINFGDRVVNDLRESTTIGYTVVSEDEAIEGVLASTTLPSSSPRTSPPISSQPFLTIRSRPRSSSIRTRRPTRSPKS